jgi:hypothetical protein
MKTIKTLAIGLAVVAAMSVASVRASLVTSGVSIGDWNQQFQENGVGNYNAMEVAWVSGSLLQVPVFTGFNVAGWSQVAGNSSVALASGPTTTDMTFYLNFVDPQVPTVFDFYAFNGATVVENTRATWNNGWSYLTAPLPPVAVPVPEPTTMIAGALLLLPFGASTLRILRRRTA